VVGEQDLEEFRRLLELERSANLEPVREYRLLNSIAAKRADWLEDHIPELFLDAASLESLS